MNERGLTLIVVTHDPKIGERARRQIRLSDGEIISDGVTDNGSQSLCDAMGESPGRPVRSDAIPQSHAQVNENNRSVAFRWRGAEGASSPNISLAAGSGNGGGVRHSSDQPGRGRKALHHGRFASIGSNLLIIVPGKTETVGLAPLVNTAPHDLTIEDTDALLARIPSVRRVAPLVVGTAAARVGERSREVTVIGATRELLDIRQLKMSSGRFLPANVRDAALCVLGSTVQRELFPNENPLGKLVRIGEWRFRVIGVIAPRGTIDRHGPGRSGRDSVETGLRLFNRGSLLRVLAEVGSHDQIETARRAVIDVLRERHANEEDVTVLTQDSVLDTFDNIPRC